MATSKSEGRSWHSRRRPAHPVRMAGWAAPRCRRARRRSGPGIAAPLQRQSPASANARRRSRRARAASQHRRPGGETRDQRQPRRHGNAGREHLATGEKPATPPSTTKQRRRRDKKQHDKRRPTPATQPRQRPPRKRTSALPPNSPCRRTRLRDRTRTRPERQRRPCLRPLAAHGARVGVFRRWRGCCLWPSPWRRVAARSSRCAASAADLLVAAGLGWRWDDAGRREPGAAAPATTGGATRTKPSARPGPPHSEPSRRPTPGDACPPHRRHAACGTRPGAAGHAQPEPAGPGHRVQRNVAVTPPAPPCRAGWDE